MMRITKSTDHGPQSNVLEELIQAAYAGSVFGANNSFPRDALKKIHTIQEQIYAIKLIFTNELSTCIHTAMPQLSAKEIQRILKEIGPKAIAFCPALAAGELAGDENLHRLGAAASAIGIMYFADQSMDRGDIVMAKAIEELQNPTGKKLTPELASRVHALQSIQSNIEKLASPEDVPIVLDCFNQQVLYNEVLLYKLSLAYTKTKDKQTFLASHANHLVELMVIDAGFPSVTTSLYAIYRQNDPQLLPLADVHGDNEIKTLLQICNAVVRIADEVGDWEIDAGHHPEWGVFSINPLNQYHPAIVTRFCELAHINNEDIRLSLQQLCRDFHTNPKKYGPQITDILFNHARDYINNLPSHMQVYSRYILLCKRVLEIGYVNMIGDQALAETYN